MKKMQKSRKNFTIRLARTDEAFVCCTGKGFLVNQDRALFIPQDGALPAVLEEERYGKKGLCP